MLIMGLKYITNSMKCQTYANIFLMGNESTYLNIFPAANEST